jgi:isopenicillin-N epimerase
MSPNTNNLRDEFLLDPRITFLNHGSFGATPRWQRELEYEPVEFLSRRAPELLQAFRAFLAEYLRTQANNLVYVQNATIGLNIVARSLNLVARDELLSTDHEYGALDRTWKFFAQKRGFKYINLHKWLCASKGSAFLFARPEIQPLIEPLVVCWG